MPEGGAVIARTHSGNAGSESEFRHGKEVEITKGVEACSGFGALLVLKAGGKIKPGGRVETCVQAEAAAGVGDCGSSRKGGVHEELAITGPDIGRIVVGGVEFAEVEDEKAVEKALAPKELGNLDGGLPHSLGGVPERTDLAAEGFGGLASDLPLVIDFEIEIAVVSCIGRAEEPPGAEECGVSPAGAAIAGTGGGALIDKGGLRTEAEAESISQGIGRLLPKRIGKRNGAVGEEACTILSA